MSFPKKRAFAEINKIISSKDRVIEWNFFLRAYNRERRFLMHKIQIDTLKLR